VSRANFDSFKYEPASTKGKGLWFINVKDIQRLGILLDAIPLSDLANQPAGVGGPHRTK
jgi:hypothetical protein